METNMTNRIKLKEERFANRHNIRLCVAFNGNIFPTHKNLSEFYSPINPACRY